MTCKRERRALQTDDASSDGQSGAEGEKDEVKERAPANDLRVHADTDRYHSDQPTPDNSTTIKVDAVILDSLENPFRAHDQNKAAKGGLEAGDEVAAREAGAVGGTKMSSLDESVLKLESLSAVFAGSVSKLECITNGLKVLSSEIAHARILARPPARTHTHTHTLKVR